MTEEMVKYGDHACLLCGSHDTREQSRETGTGGERITLMCSACEHRWIVSTPVEERFRHQPRS